MNHRFDRRAFLMAAAGVGLAGLAGAATRETRRPNIILLLADDLGYGDVGCYGSTEVRTPNLDRMAAEGVRFTDAYANAPVCSPTRVAIMTGRYQQRFGYHCEDYMGGGCPGLDPQQSPTLARYLKDAGYRTACYGKWNIGGEGDITPNAHGFDHWIGLHHNFNYFTHRAFDFADRAYTGPEALYEDGEVIERDGYITDVLADAAVDYIEAAAGDDRPFFLYVPWQAPHAPMQAPDDDPLGPAPNTTGPQYRDTYIKIVEHLDVQVGRILDAIRAAGIDQQTLVIFTNDNGGHRSADNSPLKGNKQDLVEGGIRVPWIMRWPGTIPAGTVCEQPTLTFDAAATAVGLAGARVPEAHALDGIDLMPIVLGERPPDPERTLYWRRQTTDTRRWTTQLRAKAIREGAWKYLDDAVRGHRHLYNLRRDPGETTNLIDVEPEIAARLRAKLAAWEVDVTPPDQPFNRGRDSQADTQQNSEGELGQIRGTLREVRGGQLVVTDEDLGRDITVTLAPSSQLKSVRDGELDDLAQGWLVQAYGAVDEAAATIALRQVRVSMWRKDQRGGRITDRFAEGVLRRSGTKLQLDVDGNPFALEPAAVVSVILLDVIGPEDLEPGGRVLINHRRTGATPTVNGLFYYVDR